MPPRTKKSAGTKPIFAGCVIALAGDTGRAGWKEADVARWVDTWGGTFLPDKNNSTTTTANSSNPSNAKKSKPHADEDGEDAITHILATPAQFRDTKNARVARARKAPGWGRWAGGSGSSANAGLPHIVTADWLEDSITAKRRLPEKRFSLRERQRLENARRRRDERAEKGLEKGKRLINDCAFFFS